MPHQRRGPSPSQPSRVDPAIWRACAGSLVQIPAVHSTVYYFPQGHLERSSPSLNLLSSLNTSRAAFQCVVSQLQFLADPVTDQVFAKLFLTPVNSTLEPSRDHIEQQQQQQLDDRSVEKSYVHENVVAPFAKILTPSDANNGGGFSVPRFCADSIFPPLNYQADPPVQTLSITDIHGHVWDFRHIYRGTPRRHLLTTGWSKFVNRKKLIASDSVVFMRNSMGRLFVGIRRAERYGSSGGEGARWGEHSGVKVEAVMEALERASLGLPFEVVYYPKTGWPDFIVRADVVEASMKIFWTPGVRVKMVTETEDSSRVTWFQGTVSDASMSSSGPWCGSPWRMLEVTWDEPEILQNVKRVSPWQLEFVSSSLPLHTPFPSAKRSKFPPNSGLVTDGEEDIFSPLRGLTNSTMGQMNPSLLNCNTFPAGMQGARQNTNSFFSLSNFISENTRQMCTENTSGLNIVPKLKNVCTELNMGSSQSENLSPDSHSSAYSFGTEPLGNQGCNSTKIGASSFQLFGKIIHMNQPVESGFDDVACGEDDGGKEFNETEGMNKPDLSLTYTALLNRFGVQCQGESADEETCSL